MLNTARGDAGGIFSAEARVSPAEIEPTRLRQLRLRCFFPGRADFWKRDDLRRLGASVLTEGGFVRQLPIRDLG